ncbi:hypothetical protein [Rhizobium rhizogenes]|uniref:hypothetical protein n=1 Tax=Rhizobium rhizogenes TaxID=359 RepID=UPI0014042246|nr:hypothetical protein [Rhizobium rhizogenes]
MATYNPKKTYVVKLTRAVKDGPFTHKPLNEIEMAGSLLIAIVQANGEEVIDYARPV